MRSVDEQRETHCAKRFRKLLSVHLQTQNVPTSICRHCHGEIRWIGGYLWIHSQHGDAECGWGGWRAEPFDEYFG
jgi:hypothetical protein